MGQWRFRATKDFTPHQPCFQTLAGLHIFGFAQNLSSFGIGRDRITAREDLFGAKGKFVLALLIGSSVAGGVLVYRSGAIERYLSQEKAATETLAK